MKTIVIFFVVLYSTVQSDALSYTEDFNQCVRELRLNSQEIHRLHTSDYLPEDNEDYVNFMGCFWRKIGFLHSDGRVNFDAIRMMYYSIISRQYDPQTSMSRAAEIVRPCEGIRWGTDGLTAIKAGNCLKQASRRNRAEYSY